MVLWLHWGWGRHSPSALCWAVGPSTPPSAQALLGTSRCLVPGWPLSLVHAVPSGDSRGEVTGPRWALGITEPPDKYRTPQDLTPYVTDLRSPPEPAGPSLLASPFQQMVPASTQLLEPKTWGYLSFLHPLPQPSHQQICQQISQLHLQTTSVVTSRARPPSAPPWAGSSEGTGWSTPPCVLSWLCLSHSGLLRVPKLARSHLLLPTPLWCHLAPASEGTELSPNTPTELPPSGPTSGLDHTLCPLIIPTQGEA